MEVFFYGLFMDQKLLREKGVKVVNPRKAHLPDYSLIIGNRASLIPKTGATAFGILMTVEKEAIDELYSEPSVADYIPEEVSVISKEGPIDAQCYNLPKEALSGTNKGYAARLFELGKELGLPMDYLEKVTMNN